jgi:hypothetical protein
MIERVKFYASLINPDIVRSYLTTPRRSLPTTEESLRAAIDWLCRAQDATEDGGVARSYALAYHPFFKRRGWIPSYPETTGYIIPTIFDYAKQAQRDDLFQRAIRMAVWECDVQMPNGAVKGGTVDTPSTPAVFNTGQVLFGWVRAFRETGNARFLEAGVRAGDFLLSVQDRDGAWRKQLSAYASATMPSYTYNTRSAWGLLELADAAGSPHFREAAIRNVEYALTEQTATGWFRNNCLSDPIRPLIHTIAYSLRGILEIGIALSESRYIEAARRGADELLAKQHADGRLAGRYDEQWRPTVDYSCLTGVAQMGTVWARLYDVTGDAKYLTGLTKANRFLRSVQWHGTHNPGLEGGISGSFPLNGRYGPFEVLNWAVKFFADSLMFEQAIKANDSRAGLP